MQLTSLDWSRSRSRSFWSRSRNRFLVSVSVSISVSHSLVSVLALVSLTSLLSGRILIKLSTGDQQVSTCDQQVSGHCRKSFQGQRSKIKVMARPSALLRRRHTFQRCGVEAYLFLHCVQKNSGPQNKLL